VAIFSVSVKAHSRSKGESATGGAAYRLGIDLTNELTGERHNYSNRKDVACAFTLLPENAPAGWENPAVLWNEAEKAEKRKNSCVSREVLVALPAEMTNEQREELTRSIAGELVSRYGVGLSVGIHEPDDGGSNYHAHILMTTRRLGPDGLGEKTRELDDKKQGPEQVAAIRQMVAEHTNEHLERFGFSARVDHRSLEDQKLSALEIGDLEKAAELSRAPTQHRGRNPDVARRVEVENEYTHHANQQSQAEAKAVFAAMEAAAVKEARLMAPVSDTPKSKEAMEAEDKEKRQKVEREASWVVVVEAKATQQVRLKQAQAVGENWQVAKVAGENATKAAEGACVEIAGWKKRAIEKREIVEQWEAKHPIRNFLGFRGADVTKAENQATQADENAKLAEKSRVEAKAAKVKAEEQMKVLHEQAVEHRLAAEKDQATRTEAEKDHSALIRRHQRENYTPAQVKQEALQRAADEKWETEWLEKQVQSIEARKRPQGPQQQQEQQHTRKGPQLKPDWGQSL
jgi:hypothetical protein